MNPPSRRTTKVTTLPNDTDGVWGFLQKYGNAAATVLLLAAAVYFIVRWRMNSADASRQAIASELSNARSYVQSLRQPNLERQPPQSLAALRDRASAAATDAITNVLNTSTDPAQRAGALIARGDLNWQLANLPELPGAATQPALRTPEEPSVMLSKAESAYQQVLADSTFSDQHDAIDSAHLGLAAIAENRRDWDGARKHLQAVIDGGLSATAAVAKEQLAALPGLTQVIPVVATTQPAIAPIGATFRPGVTAPKPTTTRPTR